MEILTLLSEVKNITKTEPETKLLEKHVNG
jgi:hypothetical protein